MDVMDFNSNPDKIIGYTHYMIAPLGTSDYKPKKIFVTPAVEDDKLLVGIDTMKAWGVIDKNLSKPV